MNRARLAELAALVAIAVLIAAGGARLLQTLGHYRFAGVALAAGGVWLAAGTLRSAYETDPSEMRRNVTRGVAYLSAAALAMWAIVAPARWNLGACIAAAEIALVFDMVLIAARARAVKGG